MCFIFFFCALAVKGVLILIVHRLNGLPILKWNYGDALHSSIFMRWMENRLKWNYRTGNVTFSWIQFFLLHLNHFNPKRMLGGRGWFKVLQKWMHNPIACISFFFTIPSCQADQIATTAPSAAPTATPITIQHFMKNVIIDIAINHET